MDPRYPRTFDELAEMAQFITETMKEDFERGVAGLIVLSANNNGGWQFSNIAWNFGAQLQVQDESGKWVANLNSPEVAEALEWIKYMRWAAEALPASTSLTYADWYNYIGTGRAAMSFVGSDAVAMPITNFNMDRIYWFVPMPAGPNESVFSLWRTPFMFSSKVTDEVMAHSGSRVYGALGFK